MDLSNTPYSLKTHTFWPIPRGMGYKGVDCSTKHTDGTSVLCAATLHETPNQLQNSLQATRQRLPIEDEPCTCEQEAVESMVMAGCMNRMVNMPNPLKQSWTSTGHPCWVENQRRGTVELMRATGWSAEICGSNKHNFTAKKSFSAMKMQIRMYLLQTDCRSRGSGQHIQAARQQT